MAEYPNRMARPVCSVPQRDKLTTAWLLSLPGPDTSLTTAIFREGLAMVLCVPSPVCRNRVGERIGESKVDLWGDTVKCEALVGNSWSVCHNRTKMELMHMFGWSGIPATCEVSGLFQHLIPQDALNRAE